MLVFSVLGPIVDSVAPLPTPSLPLPIMPLPTPLPTHEHLHLHHFSYFHLHHFDLICSLLQARAPCMSILGDDGEMATTHGAV